MVLKRWERNAIVLFGVVLVAVASATSSWAGAYFFVPFALCAGFVWFVYYLLTRVTVRNPLALPRHGPSVTWADGQPLGRSVADERAVRKWKQFHVDQAHLGEQDREERARIPHGGGEVGPPPNVPFP